MLKLNTFIPAELAEALPHPLKKSPSFKLKSISVAQYHKFEVWSPQLDSTLLAEEFDLLRSARKRIEAICVKLTGLIGAICSNGTNQSYWDGVHTYNRQLLLHYATKHGFTPDAGVIDVAYFSEILCPVFGKRKAKQ